MFTGNKEVRGHTSDEDESPNGYTHQGVYDLSQIRQREDEREVDSGYSYGPIH